MSTSWNLYCRDCDVVAVDYDAFAAYDTDELSELCSRADALATSAELTAGLGIFLEVGAGSRRLPLDFFATHKGHRLVPRNEYGDLLGECLVFVPCETCGHQERCRLPRGHEGAHIPKRPT